MRTANLAARSSADPPIVTTDLLTTGRCCCCCCCDCDLSALVALSIVGSTCDCVLGGTSNNIRNIVQNIIREELHSASNKFTSKTKNSNHLVCAHVFHSRHGVIYLPKNNTEIRSTCPCCAPAPRSQTSRRRQMRSPAAPRASIINTADNTAQCATHKFRCPCGAGIFDEYLAASMIEHTALS